MNPDRKAPRGLYPQATEEGHTRRLYRATGEYRPPCKGEWYLSGAVIEAYRAPNDLSTAYWIAVPIPRT